MKVLTGFIVCWTLFALGHLISYPMGWWDAPVYPVYNWLMTRSSDVQDWANSETYGFWWPWGEISSGTEL